jgi:ABC-type antimicrobial peptide transport system permease subunit
LASFSTRTLLAGQLYGVSSSDPGTLAAVSSLLIVVSALAAYIPARRVLQVDPAESLRRV